MWIAVPVAVVAAAVVAAVAFLRSEAGRTRRRGLLVAAIVAAAISILGVVPLVGIPGAVVYEFSAPWVRWALGRGYADLGDGAWPAAIVITLTWPSSLVLGYAAAFGALRRVPGPVRWLVMVMVPYATGVALSFWAQMAAAS